MPFVDHHQWCFGQRGYCQQSWAGLDPYRESKCVQHQALQYLTWKTSEALLVSVPKARRLKSSGPARGALRTPSTCHPANAHPSGRTLFRLTACFIRLEALCRVFSPDAEAQGQRRLGNGGWGQMKLNWRTTMFVGTTCPSRRSILSAGVYHQSYCAKLANTEGGPDHQTVTASLAT